MAEHGAAEVGGRHAGTGVADPVPQKDKQGGADESEARPALMEGI